MSSPSADLEEAEEVRHSILGTLVIAVASAAIILFGYSWMDSQKAPTITFFTTPQSHIAVDVRGAVSTPGVVYLDPGSRLIDVINSSGGLTSSANRSLINLSSRVVDGQMIVIPTESPAGSVIESSGLININTASLDQLKQLPGIGDVLAQRIMAYREFSGPFQSTEDLAEVEGISTSLVESLQPYITVSSND